MERTVARRSRFTILSVRLCTLLLAIAAGLAVAVFEEVWDQRSSSESLVYVWMVTLLLFSIGPAWWRYRSSGDLFDPMVVYPAIYAVTFAAPVLYDTFWQSPGRLLPIFLLRRENLAELEFLALISLAGLHIGLLLGRPGKAPVRTTPLADRGRSSILRALMVMALVLQFAGIMNYGMKNWFFGVYGWGQFQYGLAYYMLLIAQLVGFPAYFGYLSIRLSQKRYDPWIALFPLIFGGLYLWNGGRGQALFFLVSGLAVANYSLRRAKFRHVVLLGLLITAVFLSSMLFRHRSLDVSLLPDTVFDTLGVLVGEISWGGALTTSLLESVPGVIDWQYGLTYLGSLMNLLPGFLFGSNWNRPILPASLMFHRVRFPGVEGQGFGFSVLAEGYMNFGVIGGFLAMIGVGMVLGYAYRRMRTGSYISIALYAILLYQAIWYLRADSTAFVKSVFYAVAVLWTTQTVWASLKRPRSRLKDGLTPIMRRSGEVEG